VRLLVISFILPAYNEERLLGDTLRAMHAAAKPLAEPYEIIVADDASTDRTAAIAEEHGARVVRVAHRQIAATRNSGARAAAGDLFLFVDADTLVNEAVVRAAVRVLRRGAVGGGASVAFDGPVPLYAQVLLRVLVLVFRIIRLAGGCFLFCTRQAFEAVGGFDERLFASEEIALCNALKRQGRFVVLSEAVNTSGRKMRAYSGWEILRIVGRIAFRGPGAVRSREALDIWYAKRRDDPGLDGPARR
jgi:glycosyltransferase involved in cell wall biosynthesis